MAQLKRLSATDVDVLRSLQTIPSISQAVEELVLNALDANASSVLVTIDAPNLRLVVSDNGDGFEPTQLKDLVGTTRYATSKPQPAGGPGAASHSNAALAGVGAGVGSAGKGRAPAPGSCRQRAARNAAAW